MVEMNVRLNDWRGEAGRIIRTRRDEGAETWVVEEVRLIARVHACACGRVWGASGAIEA